MRPTPAAHGQGVQVHLEGIRHPARSATVLAFALALNPCRFPGRRQFKEFEPALALRWPSMNEFSPGKVIQVTVSASHDEASRNHRRRLTWFAAIGVNVANLVR